MAKIIKAADKLLMKGFDSLIDASGYDPSWDESDVLEFLKLNPGLEPKDIKINIPRHRIVAAFNRLKTAGKLPTVEPIPLEQTSSGFPTPNWLTEKQSLQAKALYGYGFWYTGDEVSFPIEDAGEVLSVSEGWTFYSSYEPGILEARVNGAVFNIELVDIDRNPDDFTSPLISKSLKKYRKALRDAAKQWEESEAERVKEFSQQLTIFESDNLINHEPEESESLICSKGNNEAVRCVNENNTKPGMTVEILGSEGLWKIDSFKDGHAKVDLIKGDRHLPKRKRVALCNLRIFDLTVIPEPVDCEQAQNWETENILLTDPPRKVGENGQLSIFWDDSEEPPDPDDYPDNYKEVYAVWAIKHPEIAEAVNKKAQASNDIWSTYLPDNLRKANRIEVGDRVQLTSDLRRIGEVKSVNSKVITVRYCDGFEFSHNNEEGVFNLFSKANSDVVLGESFFKVGERVKTSAPGHEEKIFTVNAIHYTGMIGVTLNENSLSFPANWLEHHIEQIKQSDKQETPKKKRPAKGCGTGYLKVREANKKRNAAKGRDPDIYYVYSYSYTDLWGKEIKSSISVPRDKISRVKSMIESREHYVKICKFLGKTVGCWY